jgi:SAM-dependent methyltransferase
MELAPELISEIAARLDTLTAPAVVIGAPPLAEALGTRHQGVPVLAVDPSARKARPTLVAEAAELPFAARSLSAVFAVEALSRYASPEAVLADWRRTLRPDGWLVVVERLIQSATLRALRRLLSAPRFQAPPEQLTALLLNAGFMAVGQSWPASRTRLVITSGRRASFD